MTDSFSHPHSLEGRALDLLKILGRLVDVLQRETDLLRKMKPAEMQALQQDKIVLTAAYESLLAELKQRPEALKGLDEASRQAIVEATGRFQETLSANARALYAMKEANERLFQAIVKAVEEKQNAARSYSSQGRIAVPPPARRSAPVSLAVDQRF